MSVQRLPVKAPRWPFTEYLVTDAPEMPGVVVLWENDEVVYIGRATAPTSIRQVLFDRLNGAHPCTSGASHYAWEISLDPQLREHELLDAHLQMHRALPRCNRRG